MMKRVFVALSAILLAVGSLASARTLTDSQLSFVQVRHPFLLPDSQRR